MHNPSVLELEVTNRQPDILLQDFLIEYRIHGSINYGKSSRSWNCKAAPYHHTITTMFDCWYGVLFMKSCVGFMPDVTGHTPSKKFNFCRISPQNICPKVLGIIKILFGKCETRLCVLFGQQWLLPWNSPMDAVFAQSLSYCWIVNTDLNWGKLSLQFFRCCSGFFYDLLDELSLCSWSNSPFEDNGFDCGLTLTQLSKIMWLITVLSWSNMRRQLIFHVGPGGFGHLFSLNKWNHHLKTAFCIYVHYLCVILQFVWWSECFKCDKYAKNKIKKQEGGKNLFTALYTVL